jgi:catechol-2,3-dioxygenase
MQQVSFRVASLADLKQFYSQILERGHRVDRLSNHGIALGIYFFDPEGNRLELYWRTGKEYPQPHNEPIDLNLSEPELLRILEQMPAKTAV